MPKLVKVAIIKVLRPYVKAEAKHRELMEAHKLRMDRLESMIDYCGKKLASLKDRVVEDEKVYGGIVDTLALKTDLDLLKKEVEVLRSIDLSTFFDGVEYLLKVDVTVVLNNEFNVNILADGGEKTQKMSTLETNEGTMGAEPN